MELRGGDHLKYKKRIIAWTSLKKLQVTIMLEARIEKYDSAMPPPAKRNFCETVEAAYCEPKSQ